MYRCKISSEERQPTKNVLMLLKALKPAGNVIGTSTIAVMNELLMSTTCGAGQPTSTVVKLDSSIGQLLEYDGEVIDYWKEVNQYISNNKEELEIAKRNYDNMFAKAEISEMYELN